MKKCNKEKKVVVWSTEVIRLIEGKPIGGIAVQMYFWAQVFTNNGWMVFSFAENAKNTIVREGIVFYPLLNIQRINLLLEWWYSLKFIVKLRPNIIIYRGESRNLLALALFSRLFGVKLVFFSASDSNFEPDKNPMGSELKRRMYHLSLRYIQYFVTQNSYQHDTLFQNYGKESLVQFNIWGNTADNNKDDPPVTDVVWVANFRKLKRAEWVVKVAEKLPDTIFALAGGSTGDKSYYKDMKERAEKQENIFFLGPRPFAFVNNLVGHSRVLLCTSTYEGFPNTFLQAWAEGLPVISTVDPSGVIKEYRLGEVVSTEKELLEALQRVLGDMDYYAMLQQSVHSFFMTHNAAQTGYINVLNYLNQDQS